MCEAQRKMSNKKIINFEIMVNTIIYSEHISMRTDAEYVAYH